MLQIVFCFLIVNDVQQVVERLGLTFRTARDLNHMIDELPTHHPEFHYEEVTVAGEAYPFFYRNIIECMKALYSDPDLADVMFFAPERHFKDAEGQERVYHEMNTGKWWWQMQVR